MIPSSTRKCVLLMFYLGTNISNISAQITWLQLFCIILLLLHQFDSLLFQRVWHIGTVVPYIVQTFNTALILKVVKTALGPHTWRIWPQRESWVTESWCNVMVLCFNVMVPCHGFMPWFHVMVPWLVRNTVKLNIVHGSMGLVRKWRTILNCKRSHLIMIHVHVLGKHL